MVRTTIPKILQSQIDIGNETFNTELPREFKDEGSYYRVKPQSRCESLKEMKRGMRTQKGYRKRKMQDTSNGSDGGAKRTVYDMEVEEGECDDDLRPPGEKVVKDEKEVTAEESKTEDVIVQPIGTGTIATTDTGELNSYVKVCK